MEFTQRSMWLFSFLHGTMIETRGVFFIWFGVSSGIHKQTILDIVNRRQGGYLSLLKAESRV